MGRIKTQRIKKFSGEVLEKHGPELKDNFEDNKKILGEVADIKSKKLRNVIAGYVTRLVKNSDDL
jgi:small subunit ribosomal protein S17e